ncbi:MAG: 30S ribosomal protein S3 [Chloroflexi bacterium]|nr:30S ribosomal protein S3 [Chloroflexota bacterium]
MGHKVHPIGFRLGTSRTWDARWYAEKSYKDLLAEDIKLRRFIQDRLGDAGVPRVEIERSANQLTLTIHTAKPGIVIGKSGAKVEQLRKSLEELTKKRVRVNISEIRQPETDAYLIAKSIAEQLQKRVAFKRAIKQAAGRAINRGAKGVKVVIGGRLGGSEMARREREVQGSVPLHTLRADIDFAIAEAHTTYGAIGIKVWVNRGVPAPAVRRVPRPAPAAAAPAPVAAAPAAAPATTTHGSSPSPSSPGTQPELVGTSAPVAAGRAIGDTPPGPEASAAQPQVTPGVPAPAPLGTDATRPDVAPNEG